MACECKNRCNETCLGVTNDLKCTDMCLCHDCGNCVEILYEEEEEEEEEEEKEEIEFDADGEDGEEE